MSVTTDSLDVPQRLLKRRLNILTLLTEKPLWKKRVAENLDESPQTIGRDIDALHNDGLLEHTLLGCEHGNRSTYIAFQTTDTGGQALGNYLVCTGCGDIVEPADECIHEYVPIKDADRTNGGGD